MTVEYRIGDCVEVLKEFPENHFDACVTDPPYGLEFMGKEWDRLWDARGNTEDSKIPGGGSIPNAPTYRAGKKAQEWHEAWAREVLRVLKPGAHLLAFGGTRTYHRLACAIEDAGFEIRDCLMFLYGTGFPKSLDVSKAIDKDAGIWRGRPGPAKRDNVAMIGPNYERSDKGGAATPEAKKWAGWGTALKPACEPIVVARKPLIGTVAENILKWGTGGLNIDASRIDGVAQKPWGGVHPNRGKHPLWPVDEKMIAPPEPSPLGRWPANIVLDEEAAKMLDEQAGEIAPSKPHPIHGGEKGDGWGSIRIRSINYDMNDAGGPSRFFYCAKASREEREQGLMNISKATFSDGRTKDIENPRLSPEPRRNIHPTVKPIALMRWLVRLVTPPGGTVLDPFLGSGTTLVAARNEGFSALGIEREIEYEPIIKGRLEGPLGAFT